MAKTVSCDGCGGAAEGIVDLKGKDYCPSCLPHAEEFLKAVDDAHSRAAVLFSELLTVAQNRFVLPRAGEGDTLLPPLLKVLPF